MYTYTSTPTISRLSCTAVVCAYNEQETLSNVLVALVASPLVDEVVVVDDGSVDGTPGVLEECATLDKVRAIWFQENQGKGCAMAEGILAARGDVVLFVDADLLNLSPNHAARILGPLLRGGADMVIGSPTGGQNLLGKAFSFRSISGQRAVYRQDILALVGPIRDSGYGVETLINLYYRKEEKRVRHVTLDDLIHPIKLEKVGPVEALEQYVHEANQIVRAAVRHYLTAYGLDLEDVTLSP
jgi:glycosyltransferase involved in cell wall biosynthesis